MASKNKIATVSETVKTASKPRFSLPAQNVLVENILAVLKRATPVQIQHGVNWYAQAQTFCLVQAGYFGYSVEQVASVVSALSPATNWHRNQLDAINVCQAKRAKLSISDFKVITYNGNKRKAWQALDLTDKTSLVALFNKAEKTRNFLLAILGDNNAVVVDRHAIALALNVKKVDFSITSKRYKQIADAYRAVALLVGLPATTIQAITWIVWREKKHKRFTNSQLTDWLKVN